MEHPKAAGIMHDLFRIVNRYVVDYFSSREQFLVIWPVIMRN
ncbi:hypothetical Protein YC6258_02261 [Gynuella sunshinyii YC6258]|uniref:Uncharacterized protein n=1 Tax=Gynuella sunshinyii YC6258 TaxID=1445510 RepID=A0A0C5VV72_9GAMM|nr:hypothetical Protein YC6258_02261 [Gynuella sunshinyii YC6258]